jgi:hypothetical protein
MCLSCDDGPCCAKALGNCGVLASDAVVLAIKARAAGGGKAGEVEAVFQRDRNAPEGLGLEIFATEMSSFVLGPRDVLCEVDVVARVAIRSSERCIEFRERVGIFSQISLAQQMNRRRGRGHNWDFIRADVAEIE